MKVMQINSVCGVGSTGRIAVEISSILKVNGHHSIIAYGRKKNVNSTENLRIGTDLDVLRHYIYSRLFDRHGFASTKATYKLIEYIEKYNPDIIHLHNIHGYYLNVEILFNYLRICEKTIIWTLHDCWAFTGHCAYFDYVQCEKWKDICNNCPQKGEYPKSKFMDASKKNYIMKKELFTGIPNLRIVTPSKWLSDIVKESFLKEYPINIINNGIDINTFKPNTNSIRLEHGIYDKYMILGVASVWDFRKGLQYFLDISKELDSDSIIVLIGLSKNDIAKLPKNIIGIERTNSAKELSEFYSTADVFVNPTLEDNFPTTNLEALACGTPVITFDTGGSVESVDYQTGSIVPKGDINRLKIEIESFKGKKHLYINSCILKAKQFYNKQDRFIDYLKLYESCIDNVYVN